MQMSTTENTARDGLVNRMARMGLGVMAAFSLLTTGPLLAAGTSAAGEAAKSSPPASAPSTPTVQPVAKPAGDVFEMPKKFKSTKSGLGYVVLHEGTGARAKKGQMVTVHYTGWLTNGKKFDSSRDGGRPFTFRLGEGQVIDGWEEGVALMKVGDKYSFVLPARLGYGAEGAPPDIPGNATLVFHVELLGAK